MARNSTGVVRAASQLDVISRLRNLSQVILVKNLWGGGVDQARSKHGLIPTCGNSATAHAAFCQLGDTTTFSLCEAPALCP